MVGFLSGVRGKTGTFFRTPKYGPSPSGDKQYHRDIHLDRIAVVEGTLASVALAVGVIVLLDGVWALAVTLGGFGALTLKSMDLSRNLRPKHRLGPKLRSDRNTGQIELESKQLNPHLDSDS